MLDLSREIKQSLMSKGIYDVGFSRPPDAPDNLQYAVTIIAALSEAVIDEIDGAPTHTYFHHYRTVNMYIDQMLLQAGLLLQKNGYRYIPVASSQTINTGATREHKGRYSHKKAAVLSGLGTVGKSAMFLHRELGPRVRLGTLFTDCPLTLTNYLPPPDCGECTLCISACPASAIKGVSWRAGIERAEQFDAYACNKYMREHFMQIGRGSVCGICIKVCPKGLRQEKRAYTDGNP